MRGCKVDRWNLLLGRKNERKSQPLGQKLNFYDDFRVYQKVSQLYQKASEYGIVLVSAIPSEYLILDLFLEDVYNFTKFSEIS